MTKPTIFQIKEAIVKNVCAPDPDEVGALADSKIIQTSTKREGDAELGIVLLIGLASAYGYSYDEITLLTSVDSDEYGFKLAKFQDRLRARHKRFITKIILVQNYLKLKYGIFKVLPLGQ